MQIYFHRHLFSHLSRVPILVEGTVVDKRKEKKKMNERKTPVREKKCYNRMQGWKSTRISFSFYHSHPSSQKNSHHYPGI